MRRKGLRVGLDCFVSADWVSTPSWAKGLPFNSMVLAWDGYDTEIIPRANGPQKGARHFGLLAELDCSVSR